MTPLTIALSAASGLTTSDVERLVKDAPNRYKVFYIAKRKGEELREIAQPASEVKYLQRTLMEILLKDLPIHSAATAYRKGYSLLDNASPHAGAGRPILKMDLRNFFPSIRSRDWETYCQTYGIFSDPRDAHTSARLLFFRPPGGRVLRLSIGAPSSPMLSNILMAEFDELVTQAVAQDHVTYTRYADDLTFSAPRTGYLVNVKKDVARVIRSLRFPKLDINSKKTVYATAKYHREITGLVLANDGRVTVGRDYKRTVSAMVHRFRTKGMTDGDTQMLAGKLAYISSVEPNFLRTIADKYGSDVIAEIRRQAGRLHAHGRHDLP